MRLNWPSTQSQERSRVCLSSSLAEAPSLAVFLSQCEADWELRISRKGHYQRALEEAVQTHASQWPRAWGGKNPLHGGGSFATMTPEERVSTFYKPCESLVLTFSSCDF